MSNKVIKGRINTNYEGYTIRVDGIHNESGLVVSFPIFRVTLFVGQGYLGLLDLGIFYFSHIAMEYEYFVGSKTLKIIFNSDEI